MKDQFSSHRKHNENENKKKIVVSSVLETQAKFVLGMWGKFTWKVYSAMSLSPGNFQEKRGNPVGRRVFIWYDLFLKSQGRFHRENNL